MLGYTVNVSRRAACMQHCVTNLCCVLNMLLCDDVGSMMGTVSDEDRTTVLLCCVLLGSYGMYWGIM